MRILKNRRAKSNCIQTRPIRKFRGKPSHNTAPGCSARVSTRAPGLRPHGFLDWSGCSNSLSRRRDETSLALKGFSQHAAGVRSGGHKPPLRDRPRVSALIQKTTSPSATLCSMVVRKCEPPHVVCGGEITGRKEHAQGNRGREKFCK